MIKIFAFLLLGSINLNAQTSVGDQLSLKNMYQNDVDFQACVQSYIDMEAQTDYSNTVVFT